MQKSTRWMNKAEGSLVILGLLLLVNGSIYKISGFNLLVQMSEDLASFFVLANTCFLLALVVYIFDQNIHHPEG
ncbi:MAG: hypothetical protein ABH869_04545 [Candidatus Omnitrophota bacterium]